jgi:hypothetical protein
MKTDSPFSCLRRKFVPSPALLLACALLGCVPGNRAMGDSTVLGIQGTRFSLNGAPTFLLGVSYYAALGAPDETVGSDIQRIKANGFNWIRVWATWDSLDQNCSAVDGHGRAREPFFSRLKNLVSQCDRLGLVVDVTLTRSEHGLADFAAHENAVQTLVSALKSNRNWYLDLANEYDIGDARHVPSAEIKRLRDEARRLDPALPVTASFGGHDLASSDLREALITEGLDFVCPHRPRTPKSAGETEEQTRTCLKLMRELGREAPIHYQEPFRRGYTEWEPTAADFLKDLRGAVLGGAAGWCFHNGLQRDTPDHQPRRSFDLRAKGLFEQLDSEERMVIAKAADIVEANSGSAASGAVPAQETGNSKRWLSEWNKKNPVWRGVHLSAHSDDQANALMEALPKLAAAGVNVVVLEVDYGFQFQSHPELCAKPGMSRERARALAEAAHRQGIRLIPQLNCLGHQSWSKHTDPLLVKYPQFDETPGQFPENKGIYCRSWCPQNPEVNKVVFALIDELMDAFEADAFHVGMDEVFLIGSEHCPRCKGGDPARLFAKAVNDLHGHIVGERKLEMFMWGDRLLDAQKMGYSEWEASKNHTQGAVDLVPKDIVLCDWHYEKRVEYRSVPFLLDKGFRVWPSGWQPLEASQAFSQFSLKERAQNKKVVGYLCTTWGKVKIPDAADWPPLKDVLSGWRRAE